MHWIPQASPSLRFARFRDDIRRSIDRIIDSDSYILGPTVAEFEQAFAVFSGANYCVGVNSGTDAVALAVMAVGVKPGDEVITTSLTAAGTVQAIFQAGATPVFGEIDPATRNLDPASVAAAVTPRTAAVVAVHLHGIPAAVDELLGICQANGLALVEDCAQAHGAKFKGRNVGTFGTAGAFSFYPTKNLGALGDGGAVVTNDAAVAGKVRSLRCYGWTGPERISVERGFNSRLDELQASVLLSLLPHLQEANAERRAIAAKYAAALTSSPVDLPPPNDGGVYHQFVIGIDNRDALAAYLKDNGIGTGIHYWPPLHAQPAFASYATALPVTDQVSSRILSLPIQPEVAGPNGDRIIKVLLDGLEYA
jgi:dTDP-4-amino-4,6-dideoxygalactose transaminase